LLSRVTEQETGGIKTRTSINRKILLVIQPVAGAGTPEWQTPLEEWKNYNKQLET
jgi:hypothetical protein